MIGVSGKDGGYTVELFAQHDAHQLMRPCQRAEGDDQFRLVAQRLAVAVRAADRDDQRLAAIVALGTNAPGEFFRRKAFSSLVEQQKRGAGLPSRQAPRLSGMGKQLMAFLALALVHGLAAPFGNFGDAAEFEADGRAAAGEPLVIAVASSFSGRTSYGPRRVR